MLVGHRGYFPEIVTAEKCFGFGLTAFFFFFLVFTGRTLEVLARGEALVRGEHGPLLHGHPAGHADQARLKVCGSHRARRGEKRAGDVTKRTVTGEGGGGVVA